MSCVCFLVCVFLFLCVSECVYVCVNSEHEQDWKPKTMDIFMVCDCSYSWLIVDAMQWLWFGIG